MMLYYKMISWIRLFVCKPGGFPAHCHYTSLNPEERRREEMTERACHRSVRTWVRISRKHINLSTATHICSPSASVGRWEVVPGEANGPANLVQQQTRSKTRTMTRCCPLTSFQGYMMQRFRCVTYVFFFSIVYFAEKKLYLWSPRLSLFLCMLYLWCP